MRVLIVGAGVIGIATAYYLHRSGHRVTVVERRAEPAAEASHANAGGICPGFSGPWASPGLLRKAPQWLLRANSPLSFGAGAGLSDLPWLWNFARNCRAGAFARNKARMQRVAHYSRACFDAVNAELNELNELNEADDWSRRYDFRASGVLQLFRDADDLHNARQRAVPVLVRNATEHRLLGRHDLGDVEPALANSVQHFVGGLYLPTDASGDSHKFTVALADWLVERGVVIRYNCAVTALETSGTKLAAAHTATGQRLTADVCVLAAGCQATSLLRPLRIKLPIRPVKGYSLTAPLRDASRAPSVAVMDETHKTMITRLGDRIRIAGMAEITGFDLSLAEKRKVFLQRQLEQVYPGVADFAAATLWAGLRPMTWDGPPVLGKTPIAGLYLNAGHGSSGWTQCCGTGKLLADLIAGKTPDIDLDGLTLDRFDSL